ncbi:MAG: phosphatidylinositol-specific phospholipase C domain-containing protein [Myxococcota bacterium]
MVFRGRVACLGLSLSLGLWGCGTEPPTEAQDSDSEGTGATGDSTTEGPEVSPPPATDDTGVADDTGDSGDGESDDSGSDSTGPGQGPPLDDVLRMNHVQSKGTHNSYHVEPLIPFHPSHEYSHDPLPEQLDAHGVRTFEIDVHRNVDDTITVYHILGIDQETTCETFQECLQGIKEWSDEHPLHLPVVVWVEVKDDTGGIDMSSPQQLNRLDDIVNGVFPPDQLLTPDDVQGEYDSIRERLVTEGWPTLGEVRGTVLVTILDGEHGEIYSEGYTTLAGRAMFVRVGGGEFDTPIAAIAKMGAGSGELADAHAQNMIIASNICAADESDDDCFAQRQEAVDAGIHMLKDDYAAPVADREYWLDLPDGNPAQCNPVTAPPECTSVALEDL